MLEDGGGELASNTIEKNVDTIWGSNVKCLVDILSLVVESPVQIEVRLDPGGFVSVSCVAQDPQPQYSALKITLECRGGDDCC